MRKQSKTRNSFTASIGRQVLSLPRESRALSRVTWENKYHHSEHSPLPFFPQLCAEHDTTWYGISLWSVGVSCPGCVPSRLRVHPQPAHWWGGARSWKDIESQNGLGWKGPYRSSSSSPPAMSRDTFHYTRLLRAPSSLALNIAGEGTATASLGNLCQCPVTLTVKNFFLLSTLNLPSFSLKPLPLVLSLHALVKVPQQLSCKPPSGTGRLL